MAGATGAEIVTELARRFAAGDGAGAAALFHPEIRIEQPASLPHGGWHCGLDGLAEMGAVFGQHWTRSIADPPRILGGADGAVQVTSQTWTAKATGRSATVDVIELFSFRDGKVSEIRVFQQDTALLLGTLAELFDADGLVLGAEAELGGGERVGLGHRVLGAVEAVSDELPEERVADLPVDRDVALGLVVDEVDVVGFRVAGDVGVLAEL